MHKTPSRFRLTWLGALVLGMAMPLLAQQHRATRLGNPATRFADPLTSVEQLRALLTAERYRADVEEILRQARWPGDVADLRRAATNAPVVEWPLPPGTRMPFMTSRRQGKPVALLDVLWAGKEPAPAYAFEFNSRGRSWRCVTPKACSNFYLEDLGPEPQPGLRVTLAVPETVSVCEPFELRAAVFNTGRLPLRDTRLTLTLPPGLRPEEPQDPAPLEVGELPVGEGRQFRLRVRALEPGEHSLTAQGTAAGGVSDQARARTRGQAPALVLDSGAPHDALLHRPVEVCLAVANTGEAPEPGGTLTLSVPEGTAVENLAEEAALTHDRVTWTLTGLAPGAVVKRCATFRPSGTGTVRFQASARGVCAPEVATTCATQIRGIPAILLEVVDLKDPVQVGETVTYEIRVTNQGSSPGTNIRLVCRLPENQTYLTGRGPTPFRVEPGAERAPATEALSELAPRTTATWQLDVLAVAGGECRFLVELTSDQFTRPITEDESTLQY
jgi:uncharacterized repeat protein (TIGR01451 family)